MPGRKQTSQALSNLAEVRTMIREAEVELRESAYYPSTETLRHLSEAASSLAGAEQALRSVLGILGEPSKTQSEPSEWTEGGKQQEQTSVFPTKILLATDGSEEAAFAAHTAADIAHKTGSQLHVVYVSPPLYYAAGYNALPYAREEALQIEQEELDRKAQTLLETQVEQIKAAGGAVTQAHLRIGKPDAEIVTLSEEIDAGLIIMGSRGFSSLSRLLIGSVADSVVRHARCPVWVMRKEDQ